MYAPTDQREQRIKEAQEQLHQHRKQAHGQDNVFCPTGDQRRHAYELAILEVNYRVKRNDYSRDRDHAFAALANATESMDEHHRKCGCPETEIPSELRDINWENLDALERA